MTALVTAGTETPKAFFATTLNVYEVPFFNPVISTGLVSVFFSEPVFTFVTMYSAI